MPITGTSANTLTVLDIANRVDPDGGTPVIAEILQQTNEMLLDSAMIEANGRTHHVSSQRTSYPSGTWRQRGQGVGRGKSTVRQVIDTMGSCAVWSEVDAKDIDETSDPARQRLIESRGFFIGLGHQWATAAFYSDVDVNPLQFHGFAPRFNAIDGSALANENSRQVIDAGFTNQTEAMTQTSVWFIVWGENTAHFTYPKGSMAGINRQDFGKMPLQDSNGNEYIGYKEYFELDVGLAIKDPRYVVRLANIDTSLMTPGAFTATESAELLRAMVIAYNRIENMGFGVPVVYCNRTVKTFLDIIAMEKNNVNLTIDQYAGKRTTMFLESPIRRVDALLNTEAWIDPAP